MSTFSVSYTIQEGSVTDLVLSWKLRQAGLVGILAADINTSATTFTTAESVTLTNGTCILLGSEIIQVTATATGTSFSCSRNVFGTGAASHIAGTSLYALVYPDPFTYIVNDYFINAHKSISNALGTQSSLNSLTSVTGSFA